jgi:acyl-CoA dehydrogenase
MNLSTTDFDVFFEAHHHDLGAHLAAMRDPLLAAEAGQLDDDEDDTGPDPDDVPGSISDRVFDRDRAVATKMGELGLYYWLLPEQDDPDEPTPPDVRALCLIREFLGQVSPLADAIFAVQGLGSYPVLLAGKGMACAALIDQCRSGASIGGFALTEPEAGSDVASLQSRARLDFGRIYRLEGTKTLISNVGIADYYVVFANAEPEAGRKGISAFLLRSGAPGLEERPIALNIDHPIGELRMDGCEAELIGQVGQGFKLALQTLDTFRVTVGAAAMGMAGRALGAALEHVRARKQFGRALAEHQIVQSYLADMATELDAARLLVLRAALSKDRSAAEHGSEAKDERRRLSKEAAMAKLYATEAAQRIIDRAVQLFGGRGVTSGQVVENLYRAIRPLRIYEGTSEIQRLIIGRTLANG